MNILEKYRWYRLEKLYKKWKDLNDQFKHFYYLKELMTEDEYEMITDIIAGDMVRTKRKIEKLGGSVK